MAKRNAQGQGTIRRRPNGLWEARFTVGHDPATGKQKQKSVYGKSPTEVRKKLTQAQSDMDHGIYADPVRMTVGEWADIWLQEYTGAIKLSTREQYAYHIRQHIKPNLNAVKLKDLNAPMIQRMYRIVQEKHKVKQKDGTMKEFDGISPKSVRNLHGVLTRMLSQAVELDYIIINPCDKCKLPRIEKKEMHPVQDEHVKQFLNAIKGDRFEHVFYVDMLTGLRLGEITGLTWDCIDFKKGTIKVYRQLQRQRGIGTYAFTSLKNDKERTITPAPSVIEILKTVRKEQAESKLRVGSLWSTDPIDKNLVFTNEYGRHFAHHTIYTHLKSVAKSIGIPETRFHDLRHTFATLSIQNGDDIKTVSENLGHATVAFTLDVYGHVTEKMRKDSADRMEQFIANL